MGKAVKMEDETTDLVPVVTKTSDLQFESNFDKIKKQLGVFMKKYKGLKITDANYQDAMAVKKMCVSTRNMLEASQKDTIRLFFKVPETALKGEFTNLLSLVGEVESGLDAQLDVFEEERKSELTEVFKGYIDKLQEEFQLLPQYLKEIELKKAYFNKTAKEADTRADLRVQFEEQAKAQQARKDDEDMIRNACKGDDRLNPELFVKQLDLGRMASAIMRDIEEEKIRLSPMPPVDSDAEKVGEPVTISLKKEKMKKVSLELTYPESMGPKIEAFFKANGIKYTFKK